MRQQHFGEFRVAMDDVVNSQLEDPVEALDECQARLDTSSLVILEHRIIGT